jgi:ferredoxin
MTNIVYHKGSFCTYATRFCQEGYCLGCEIYLNKGSSNKPRELSNSIFLREAVGNVKR